MPAQVIASDVLANGLRTEFADTYMAIRNRQANSKLADVMDLGMNATNRKHEFAYFNAAPHMEYWRRGDTIPTDAFDSVEFTTYVHEYAKRVPWSKWDRHDDQTSSLMDMARQAGESAGLLPERFFFDLLTQNAGTLPAIPNAPDGASFFSTTDGSSANRFGVSNGNLLTGTGVASVSTIRADFYSAIEQWKQYQDGKGQPLLSDDVTDGGYIIIYPVTHLEAFEEAFLQRRQGLSTSETAVTNLVQDASRDVTLWATSRLAAAAGNHTANDWYIFLRKSPKKPTFLLNRSGVQEFSSLEGDNNSDHTRDTAEEYVQWETRQGAGIALPFGAIKINN